MYLILNALPLTLAGLGFALKFYLSRPAEPRMQKVRVAESVAKTSASPAGRTVAQASAKAPARSGMTALSMMR